MSNKLPPPKIHILGNVLQSQHRVGNVYDPNGISPTIMENHGKVALVLTKEVVPFNPDTNDLCRTLKAQYFKVGAANYIRGGAYAATAAIEIIRYEHATTKDDR